jgi:hypothetical protein
MGHIKRRLIWIGITGGIGGAVNALLCYLSFPVPVKALGFQWHLIPAGMLHGSILGLCAVQLSFAQPFSGDINKLERDTSFPEIPLCFLRILAF